MLLLTVVHAFSTNNYSPTFVLFVAKSSYLLLKKLPHRPVELRQYLFADFWILGGASNVDPHELLAASSVEIADQRNVDSIASHHRVKIQIQIVIEIRPPVANDRNRVAIELHAVDVDVLAIDVEEDVSAVKGRVIVDASNLKEFQQTDDRRQLIDPGVAKMDLSIAFASMVAAGVAFHGQCGKGSSFHIFNVG